jgi:hypothetical protein
MAVKFQGGKAAATRKYKLGDQWSSDFDYVGMLAYFRQAMAGKLSIAQMEQLYSSMEDVNYHTENQKLRAKIEEMKGAGIPQENNASIEKAHLAALNALGNLNTEMQMAMKMNPALVMEYRDIRNRIDALVKKAIR